MVGRKIKKYTEVTRETKIMKDDGSGFLKKFLDQGHVKKAHGKPAEQIIAGNNEDISVLRKDVLEKTKTFQEGRKLDSKLKTVNSKIADREEKIERGREEMAVLNEEFEKKYGKKTRNWGKKNDFKIIRKYAKRSKQKKKKNGS